MLQIVEIRCLETSCCCGCPNFWNICCSSGAWSQWQCESHVQRPLLDRYITSSTVQQNI